MLFIACSSWFCHQRRNVNFIYRHYEYRSGRACRFGRFYRGMAYELGGGLGVTFFGLFLTAIYKSQLELAGARADSIAETIAYAKTLPLTQMNSIITAAQVAFSSAHSIVLVTCGSI